MDVNREWTVFAVEAEIDDYGVGRLVKEHNRLRAELKASQADVERLTYIASEYLKIDSFNIPTGQGDADVGWRISQYRMGWPSEKVMHEHFSDDLRAAIDATRSSHAED